MATITSELLEQYLDCPRHFYFSKIRGIKLAENSRWEVIEWNRNRIKKITFEYCSYLSKILGQEIGKKIENLEKLSNVLPLSSYCVFATSSRTEANFDLIPKICAYLNFVLFSIWQESKLKHKKKRIPVSLTFLPKADIPHDLICENPTALIEYSDNKTALVHQNYTSPQEKGNEHSTDVVTLFLVNLFHSNLTRIISIDYRTMKISFDSISKYKSQFLRSKLHKKVKYFTLQEFEPQISNVCDICEFKMICDHSKEGIRDG